MALALKGKKKNSRVGQSFPVTSLPRLCHWKGERPSKEKVSLLCVLTWSSRTEEGRKGLDVQELGKPCMAFPLRGGQMLVSYMHSYLCMQLQCGLVGSLGGKDVVVAVSGRVSLKSSV